MASLIANHTRGAVLLASVLLVLVVCQGCKRTGDGSESSNDVPTTPLASLPVANMDALPAEVREQFQADLRFARKRPDDASALGKVAMMHHAYEFYGAAAEWYVEAIARAQRSGNEKKLFLYRYYLADVQARLGDQRAATFTLAAALSRNPDDVHAHLRQTRFMEVFSGRPSADPSTRHPLSTIRMGYRRVVDRDPSIAPAHFGLARVEIESDKPRGAIPHLEEALRLAPNYLEAREALITIKEQIGDAAGAAALRDLPVPAQSDSGYVDPYLERLEDETSYAKTKLQHALRLVQQGFAQEAEAYVRLITVQAPTAGAWDTLGTIEVGRMAEAEMPLSGDLLREAKVCYLTALELDPAFHQARLNYAQILKGEGDLSAAIDMAREIIARDDTYWRAHYQLGQWLAETATSVASEQGPLAAQPIYQQAKRHYEKTIDLHPDNMFAFAGWAEVLGIEGRYQEMHDLLRRAVHRQPDDPGVADPLALLLATCEIPSIRRPEEALRISLRVFEVTGGSYPQYTLTLAIAYENVEDFDAALNAINDAIDEASLQGLDDLVTQLQAHKKKIDAEVRESGR